MQSLFRAYFTILGLEKHPISCRTLATLEAFNCCHLALVCTLKARYLYPRSPIKRVNPDYAMDYRVCASKTSLTRISECSWVGRFATFSDRLIGLRMLWIRPDTRDNITPQCAGKTAGCVSCIMLSRRRERLTRPAPARIYERRRAGVCCPADC